MIFTYINDLLIVITVITCLAWAEQQLKDNYRK